MAYVLGITRVDPIRHQLLFERFINEGRTAYPDVDIDFASSRREEVIQYVYERYGAEHAGMVCNVVTYRARSAVREVGYALGFPRPLVDRVAKALETYDSVMVRRDLEAEGGFARVLRAAGDGGPAAAGHRGGTSSRGSRGVTDMGQLNHARGGRLGSTASDRGRRRRSSPSEPASRRPGERCPRSAGRRMPRVARLSTSGCRNAAAPVSGPVEPWPGLTGARDRSRWRPATTRAAPATPR